MGLGLIEYKENDPALQLSTLYRFLFTAGFTGGYFLIARKYHFFQHINYLNISTGLVSILSFYYARGFGLHLAALNAKSKNANRLRSNQNQVYSRDPLNYRY